MSSEVSNWSPGWIIRECFLQCFWMEKLDRYLRLANVPHNYGHFNTIPILHCEDVYSNFNIFHFRVMWYALRYMRIAGLVCKWEIVQPVWIFPFILMIVKGKMENKYWSVRDVYKKMLMFAVLWVKKETV